MRESVVVYRNFLRAVQTMPPEKRGGAYEAYLLYALDGEEYKGGDCTVAALLECFRAQIDRDRVKYEAQAERARKTAEGRHRNDIVRDRNDIDTTSYEVGGVNVNVNDNKKISPNGDTKKAPKHKYGENGLVLLTDEEYAKLKTEYGADSTSAAILFLDNYIAMRGYKAKSHYLAMRKWVFDAIREDDIKRQELAQREQRLRAPKKGQFTGQRKDDLDSAVLSDVLKMLEV